MKAGRVFLWGIGAGTAAVLMSFLIRVLLGGTYLPELASATVFSLVPGFLESSAVENLGPLAKYSAFATASALNVFLLGLIPVLLNKLGRMPRDALWALIVLVVSPYLIMLSLGSLFLSLVQVSSQQISLGSLASSLIIPSLVFGAIASSAGPVPTASAPVLFPQERTKGGFGRKRRLFLKSTIATTAAAVILYYGVGLLFSKQGALVTTDEANRILSAQVTPNSEFYRVDVNVIPPSVESSTWKLKLHGLVSNPVTLDYNQLLSLPSVEQYATLECVSNKVGGDLMSTALWKGVALRDVLKVASGSPEADYVVFRCFDGYDVGIPMDKAMTEGTILAYEMNGERLPVEHGYPVRVIVPGLYGMMNAKWITDIELVKGVYNGFWQRKGWTNTASYQTGSTILTPGSSLLRGRFSLPPSLVDVTGNPIAVVGAAFAGDRGIKKVEVSTDGGNTWNAASVHDPLSKYTWVFWRFEWNPPSAGNYELMVRATDGKGQLQVATMTDPFPNGATGFQVIDVKVSNP